jgi:hypothetical protein
VLRTVITLIAFASRRGRYQVALAEINGAILGVLVLALKDD